MSSLEGIRVLEMGSLIAGPFAGQLLADHGADVLKVEAPGVGDPMRRWGLQQDGESLWWPSIARGKRSLAIDLRTAAGADLIRRLAPSVDVVLENFRPGMLDQWGIGHAVLAKINPRLITVHVSGYGQTGPMSSSPGFGSIGEAMGGLRFTTGSPDRPPARTGVSLGDSLAALFAVIGTLMAITERDRSGRGQEVDVAIYEAVAALMESTMADHLLGGVTRTRSGSVLPGVAPSNCYATEDGVEVLIAANSDSVFARLCIAMEQPGLADDARFATHQARALNMVELDELIGGWTGRLSADAVFAELEKAAVPAGRIFTAADMVENMQYQARGMISWLQNSKGVDVPAPGVVPKLSRSPGVIRSAGPELGAHTRAVLRDLAGVDEEEWEALSASSVVGETASRGDLERTPG